MYVISVCLPVAGENLRQLKELTDLRQIFVFRLSRIWSKNIVSLIIFAFFQKLLLTNELRLKKLRTNYIAQNIFRLSL